MEVAEIAVYIAIVIPIIGVIMAIKLKHLRDEDVKSPE